MSFHAHLLLPDTEESVLKTIVDAPTYNAFISSIDKVVSVLRKSYSAKLYYDSENIKSFIRHCSTFQQEKYLSKVQTQLRVIINSCSTDITTKPMRKGEQIYFLWNFNKMPTVNCNPPQIIVELIERIPFYKTDQYLLLNIGESVDACREVILAFKDAPHLKALPSEFIRIPFICDSEELVIWLDTPQVADFTLLNKTRFSRTNKLSQGKTIFKETSTGHYWYLDNLHKNHYEVFNSDGIHLGIARMNGEIDYSKAKDDRTIEL